MRPKKQHQYPIKQKLEELKLDNRYDVVKIGPGDYKVVMDFMNREHELYRCNNRFDAESWLMAYIDFYENPNKSLDEVYND
jgi:hypothetical protein